MNLDDAFGELTLPNDSFDLMDIPVPFHAMTPTALREYVFEVRKLSQMADSQGYNAAYRD